ncbi:MAG: hypothetical protein IPH59_04600 [bacterium]|nr:hypothetical protein [bacterium]
MKINRVLSSETMLRGEQMAKKKEKTSRRKGDSVELSAEALNKAGKSSATQAVSSNKVTSKQKATTLEIQPADNYRPGRPGAEVPLRSEKIEHAKKMIQSKGYDDPQVVAAIIDRLVFALKE